MPLNRGRSSRTDAQPHADKPTQLRPDSAPHSSGQPKRRSYDPSPTPHSANGKQRSWASPTTQPQPATNQRSCGHANARSWPTTQPQPATNPRSRRHTNPRSWGRPTTQLRPATNQRSRRHTNPCRWRQANRRGCGGPRPTRVAAGSRAAGAARVGAAAPRQRGRATRPPPSTSTDPPRAQRPPDPPSAPYPALRATPCPRTSNPPNNSAVASAITSTARSKTSRLCAAGSRNPETFRTYCRAAARISASVASSGNTGGRSVLILRHIPPVSRPPRRPPTPQTAALKNAPAPLSSPPTPPGMIHSKAATSPGPTDERNHAWRTTSSPSPSSAPAA